MKPHGVIAAGHQETAKTAELILREGGNAFDAVVAAHLAACVVEPVLASLGGGSYLMAHTREGRSLLYDFFVHTPKRQRPPDETDFHPISANFGTAQQEFHIGLGACATPGAVKGLFTIQRELCTMPMTRLAEPAIALAREGVIMNRFQSYIFDIVRPIYLSSAASRQTYGSLAHRGKLINEGELLRQPQLADCLEALAREGAELFYQGEIARKIDQLCAKSGGHLSLEDLEDYRVIKRKPLKVDYHEACLLTNPPPSSGGLLIAFALKLLEEFEPRQYPFGSALYLDLLAQAMDATRQARMDASLDEVAGGLGEHLLKLEHLGAYRQLIKGHPYCSRGTTHISAMDRYGNIASLTTSNGEGCGHVVPDTGIMLNNMLGEEDLNPLGLHRWPPDRRMTSMMAPSIAFLPYQRQVALGSGGSNRLRTAILQVLLNLIDFTMPLEEAVNSPRIHYERGYLSLEGGFAGGELQMLLRHYPQHKLWPTCNLFFGGVHCVEKRAGEFSGIGDQRRGGVARVIA